MNYGYGIYRTLRRIRRNKKKRLSYEVTLPPVVVESLGWEEGSRLYFKTEGKELIVRKHK